MKIRLMILALLLVATANVRAACHVVIGGASGSHTGADWNNPYSALPASLVRGDVYYVSGAGTSYGPYNFNVADSGATTDQVLPATPSDHCTATGWTSGMAAQAVFTCPSTCGAIITFSTDYHVFNGQARASTGNPLADWSNESSYGIKLDNSNGHAGVAVAGGSGYTGATCGSLAACSAIGMFVHDITVKNVDLNGAHTSTDGGVQDVGFDIEGGSYNILITGNYIHHIAVPIFMKGSHGGQAGGGYWFGTGSGNTIEKNYLAHNYSSPAHHSEGCSCSEGLSYFTYRWNISDQIGGVGSNGSTAHIGTASGAGATSGNGPNGPWFIYGNIFTCTATDATNNCAVGDGVLAIWDATFVDAVYFLNNTINNIGPHSATGFFDLGLGYSTPMTKLIVENNIASDNTPMSVVNSGTTTWNGATFTAGTGNVVWDYQSYFNTTTLQTDTSSNKQTFGGNPYVGSVCCTLAADTAAGVNTHSIVAGNDVDMLGVARGASGTFDRGALQIPASAPLVPTSLLISPHGSSLKVGSSQTYAAACKYSGHADDDCTAAGGVTWRSTAPSAATITSGGVATWNAEPCDTNGCGAGHAQGAFIIATANGVNDQAGIFGQHVGDLFYLYMTPAYTSEEYTNLFTGATLPMTVVTGAQVPIGAGLMVNNADAGTGQPYQDACTFSSSDVAKGTIDEDGMSTAGSTTGTVTYTCATAGDAVYGTSIRPGWSAPGNTVTLTVTAGGSGTQDWFVRPDGGLPYTNATDTPAGQCDGKHDAPYPGSGVNQPCAFAKFRHAYSDEVSYQKLKWVISGGDRLFVDCGTDGCNTGLDAPSNTGWFPQNCHGLSYNCSMPTIPSGTAARHTKILAKCYPSCTISNATQLNVSYLGDTAIRASDTQFADIDGFHITDKGDCGGNGSWNHPCDDSSNAGTHGIIQSALTSNVNYHVWIRDLAGSGIFGASGSATNVLDHSLIEYTPFGGIDMDDHPWGINNISVAGGWTQTYTKIAHAGCSAEYPRTHTNPQKECHDQSTSGGAPDGLGTAATIGDWLFDHDLWFANFQDALDLLHSHMHNLTVTNNFAASNDGQAYKIGSGKNVIFRQNFASVDCARILHPFGDQNPASIIDGVSPCRAAGDGVLFVFGDLGNYYVQGNTFIGYNSTMFDLGCLGGWDTCTGANTVYQNNIVKGYASSFDGNDGRLPGLFYANDMTKLPGTFLTGWKTQDHNLFFDVRSCPNLGASDSCNTANPLFPSQPSTPISTYSDLDNFDYSISSSSPAKYAGVNYSGMASTDANGTTWHDPRSLGPVEFLGASPALCSPFCGNPNITGKPR